MINKCYLKKLIESGFEKRLDFLKKKLKGKTIVIYGAGRIFNVIDDNYDLSEFNIIGISDMKYSQSTNESEYKGYKIIAPKDIKTYNPDYIILAIERYEDILKDFRENIYKNTKIKVISFIKYNIKQKISNFIENNREIIMQNTPFGKLQLQIDTLQYFLSKTTDITKFPQATGEAREQQMRCLEILCQVVDIINENNLEYWLDSGTLLGAYRNKGYIPWDGDIDICMTRKELIKIIPIFKEKFKDSQFYIREYSKKYKNFQIRIIAKNNSRIGVDIFPVEFYYGEINTELDKYKADLRIRKARKILKNKSKEKDINNDNMGLLRQKFVEIEDKYVQPNKKEDKTGVFFAIDFPYNSRGYLVMEKEMVFPLKEISFEGRMFKCPNRPDKYLENLFNNYMEYPRSFEYWRV